MLTVDSQPSGAVVYLNDHPRGDTTLRFWRKEYLTTAAKIKNLLPGEYVLRLEKTGYWPFQKRITILSGQTTFAEEINLFRSDEPLLVATTGQGEVSLSFDHKYLYESGASRLINLKGSQIKKLAATADTPGTWLKNSEKILVGGQLFDLEKNSQINYREIIGAETTNWHLDESDNRLFYQNKNTISYFRLDQRVSLVALSGENYLTYEPRGDDLFTVVNDQGKIILKKYSLKEQKLLAELTLPSIGQYKFISDGQKRLTLYDQQNKTLYLINPTDFNTKTVIQNVFGWQWLNEETIIYNNNWELYTYNLGDNNSLLITRFSEKIEKIIWHQANNYLIFSTAKNLNTIDLTSGTITTILRADQISSPVLDDKNDYLYFLAGIGKQIGIYKIVLQ